jgi:hypothetical protein
MFKSSTALFVALVLGLSVASAQQPDPRQTGNVLGIKADAPDQYVVQRGDTLWGIAGKFLSEPWRWPDIWRLNKDQIRNPHLIYPGNVVRLDRATGMLSIDRLEPRVRVEPLTAEAIPTIPLKVIEPFLARPLVIERGGLDKAPQIVATQEGRFNIGAGARAYVDGLANTKETLWQVYRPGSALVDPDTNEALGYEAIYLGAARLMRQGGKSQGGKIEPATIQILSAVQEISEGDRLVVAPQPQLFSFAPRAPEKPVRARVMSIYDGRNDARFDYRGGAATTLRRRDREPGGGEPEQGREGWPRARPRPRAVPCDHDNPRPQRRALLHGRPQDTAFPAAGRALRPPHGVPRVRESLVRVDARRRAAGRARGRRHQALTPARGRACRTPSSEPGSGSPWCRVWAARGCGSSSATSVCPPRCWAQAARRSRAV